MKKIQILFFLIGIVFLMCTAEKKEIKSFIITDLNSKTLCAKEKTFLGRANLQDLPDKTWVLVYTESPGHASLQDMLHIRFSNDGGETWSAEDTYLDGSHIPAFPAYPPMGGPNGNHKVCEGYLYLAPNKNLILHTWQQNRDDMIGTWQMTSSDGGKTWSEWQQIDIIGKENDEEIFFWGGQVVYKGVIYTGAGEFMGLENDGKDGRWNHIHIQSADNGKTWRYVSEINHPKLNSVEKGFEYIGKNTLVFVGSHGGFDKYKGRRSLCLHGYSYDLGKTWEPWADIIESTQVWDRPRIFTLAHLKGKTNWWTDPVLIGCGNSTPKPGVAFPRKNCIWYSLDHGKNWSAPLPVDEFYQDGGYGDLLYDKTSDKVVFISYRSRKKDKAEKYDFLKGEAEIVQYKFKFTPVYN